MVCGHRDGAFASVTTLRLAPLRFVLRVIALGQHSFRLSIFVEFYETRAGALYSMHFSTFTAAKKCTTSVMRFVLIARDRSPSVLGTAGIIIKLFMFFIGGRPP